MSDQTNKRVLLGVSGGIAAYKSPDLVRRLRERGHEVRVVMTRGAQDFITPLSLQAVSGQAVHTTLLDEQAEAAMGHIELARWADVVLIAPATADIIARLAHGLADDLLTTLCLATEAPIVLAPAMNHRMWVALATQANIKTLTTRGVRLLGPGSGDQACGEVGEGRMLEPAQLAADLDARVLAGPGDTGLAGLGVLITAGPTREAIDPVRYISNHSSGKMGYAVAAAARAAGASVILVSGPSDLPVPPGVERVQVESAAQMRDAVLSRVDGCDIFIAAAAVADYRPANKSEQKIKKKASALEIALVRNPDILAEVAAGDHAPFTVGFAAETEKLEAHARDKLERKSLDMIAANTVAGANAGFGVDTNRLRVFWKDGEVDLGESLKTELAQQLVALVIERFREKHPA
ncbi:MAG: bifunctional phosphopantothenoylcysteine decarboxylase/phosphopantothenate--cysteine ligase CoaBC [Gammaproteobacteria bacterium]|jgi:phosphopantothenoylcysteine decarboxylase/phosphopantothenate--cysteine ligase|nr:bifunctional phosphopantothenoylcysteine decarboxylase/phosphopantothenate--cysteine ligase CoaBC [Gammaproteobacteria bacterium]NCF82409.1 bifunctional phosphopantothenoylcysteine decarboxylase/phosphopantothenate--cysteine ligase CoaBC [Pseudomonadota bacterium]